MNGSKIASSIFWSFLEQGGTKVVALAIQVILARILLPEMFGVLAILLVVVELANAIAQSGLGTSLIQNVHANDASYSTALWLSLAMATVLYIVIFLLAPAIASFYNMPELEGYLQILALVVYPNAANSIQLSYLQKRLDFKAVFRVNIGATLFSGVLGIIAALSGLGIWALIAQILSQSIVSFVVFLIVVPWRPRLLFCFEDAKELFSYGWKVSATGILSVLYTGLSELVIGKTCAVESLGYYSQGRKWPNAAISLMGNALQNVFFPVFSSLKHDPIAFQKAIQKALIMGSFAVIPVSLLFAVIAEPLITLLLTDKWILSVPIFQMTCISNCVLILQLVNLRAYMALGDSALYLKLQIIKVIMGCAVICSTAVITKSIYWVAFATSAFGIFAVVAIDLHPARKKIGFGRRDQIRLILPICALSIFASGVSMTFSYFTLPPGIKILFQVMAFVSVYFLGAHIFKLKSLDEYKKALSTLMQKKRPLE